MFSNLILKVTQVELYFLFSLETLTHTYTRDYISIEKESSISARSYPFSNLQLPSIIFILLSIMTSFNTFGFHICMLIPEKC